MMTEYCIWKDLFKKTKPDPKSNSECISCKGYNYSCKYYLSLEEIQRRETESNNLISGLENATI